MAEVALSPPAASYNVVTAAELVPLAARPDCTTLIQTMKGNQSAAEAFACITDLRSLVRFHGAIFSESADLVFAVCEYMVVHLNNLRSAIVRNALACSAELASTASTCVLNSAGADNFISTLLLRACNDKRFIRDAALAALGTLADTASDSVSTVVSFLRHSCSKSRPLVLASAEHSRRHLSALRPAALASLDLQAVAPLIACFMRSKAAEARAAAAAMGCTLALARGEEAWQEALRATCSPSDVAALVASTAAALQEHRRAAQARADACGAADDGPDGSSGAGGGATAVACSAAIPVAASASSSWSSPVPCRSASGRRSLGAPGSAAHSTPRQLALRAFIRERSAQKAGAADGVDVVAAPYSAGGASASATATATAATSASAPRPAAAAPIAPSGVSLPATIAELGPASPSALTTHGMRCTFISLDGTETTACSSSSSAAAAATGAAASSSSSSRSLAAAAPPRRSDATPAVARVLRLSVGGPGEPLPRYVPSPVSAAAAAGAGAAALAALSTGVSNVASADAAASGKVAAQLIAAAAAAPVAIVDKENGGGL